MITTLAFAALCLQSAQLGTSAVSRIQGALDLLGSTHAAVREKYGKPSASVEGDGVWVYGPWAPSPRVGFTVAFFHEDDDERIIDNTVQYVSGSVGEMHPQALTVGGTRQVPKDFCWTSGESTSDVLKALGASNAKYYAQKDNPAYVLCTCDVKGKPVYIFSRQIEGSTIIPCFGSDGSPSFEPARLDIYAFAVGHCSLWHYTAGFTQEKIIGPGSYEDKSLSDDPWIVIG